MWFVNAVFLWKVLFMIKYISIFRLVFRSLLVAKRRIWPAFQPAWPAGRRISTRPATRPVSISAQYLNCKFCMVTLLRPWPNAFGMRKYLSGNYVILSPKSSEDQKKKKKKKGLVHNLGLYSAGIWGIYSCWQTLFRLIIQRSNFGGGTRRPYNLSTKGLQAANSIKDLYLC